ncbi:GNAT family N-acetyltransferase [Aquicella siphonis]|uniref:GNAT family N-acetyltransferase n=1 Tax=Aquicella siphonis TaxID=254247 RepID=UPI001E33922B|nr:GNAT family N-acetyltransferase [Aquicella siphonis]
MTGYQADNQLRDSFNQLAVDIFKLSFEDWYQSGFWKEKYIPYTLFDQGSAVANVSVNIMDFYVFGRRQRYIQIGTVMTAMKYRNQGLCKFLMEHILDQWNTRCDLIYLFANHSVLNFYPKLGFTRVKEYEYFKDIKKGNASGSFEKLDMKIQGNRDKLYEYAKNSYPISVLSMHENADLVMFYGLTILSECVYYLPLLDAIAIAQVNNNQLVLYDVFCKAEVDLEEIINILLLPCKGAETIVLGFTPRDCSSFESREIANDDALFIRKGKTGVFTESRVMFPLLSHA